jgi:hypothetical protein
MAEGLGATEVMRVRVPPSAPAFAPRRFGWQANPVRVGRRNLGEGGPNARKANLVKAPRRNRGEVGSKPTPSPKTPGAGTPSAKTPGLMGHAQGCRHALQASPAGSVTPVLHHSFPSGEQGARGCLLSRGQAGSIPARGANSLSSSSGQDAGPSTRKPRVRIPPTAPSPPIAQRSRAPACEAGGRRFESCWVAQFEGLFWRHFPRPAATRAAPRANR